MTRLRKREGHASPITADSPFLYHYQGLGAFCDPSLNRANDEVEWPTTRALVGQYSYSRNSDASVSSGRSTLDSFSSADDTHPNSNPASTKLLQCQENWTRGAQQSSESVRSYAILSYSQTTSTIPGTLQTTSRSSGSRLSSMRFERSQQLANPVTLLESPWRSVTVLDTDRRMLL